MIKLRKFSSNNKHLFLPKIVMNVIVFAHDWQKEELLSKSKKDGVEFMFINTLDSLTAHPDADAYLLLKEITSLDHLYTHTSKPVLINSVTNTLADIKAPSNFHRINGWASFIRRELWEVSTNDQPALDALMSSLGYSFKIVKDEPGFVAARVVSMIINEAYFALEQKVSTKTEIDIAMRLGTNYPFGPFDWGEKIGLSNINGLLTKLHKTDGRYKVCSALTSDI
jgi:3-hydroxybutyryl-CoA dehydrogenase